MNLVMVTIYGPASIVDWDRYYYGFVHIIHFGEEDSSLDLASAWKWTEEAEVAIGYVLSVLWLGVVGGGTRILHNKYVQKQLEQQQERNTEDDEDTFEEEPSSARKQQQKQRPVVLQPLNNVLVPVVWSLFFMLIINATQYNHAPGLYNGFAVGAYVAMASLQKIPTVSKFVYVSLLAAGKTAETY
mmetsp:Transcript_11886/g.20646  ORF Transcript_11886/g.20646 Transcript_11886/m.20646 type:complete len:186 (+) Transcript_11886:601-1158(+)